MIDEQDQSTLGHTSQRDMMEPYDANICTQTDRVCNVFAGGQASSEGHRTQRIFWRDITRAYMPLLALSVYRTVLNTLRIQRALEGALNGRDLGAGPTPPPRDPANFCIEILEKQ